jgi:MAPEG family
MASILIKTSGFVLAGSFLESKYGPRPNKDGPLGLSTLAGLTPLIFTAFSFWTVTHGFEVGKARTRAIEDAKESGEADVEDRYNLPNLYAQGTSRFVKVFNCVQRSHQHILETFTQALATGLIACVHFPITAAISSLAYAVGRRALSIGYAKSEGEPSKRYSSPVAVYCWYGLLSNMMLAGLSCVNMIAGKKLLW